MSLDVAYRGRIIKLALDKTKGYNFSVNSEKCKNISTKTVDFLDGVLLTCDVISSPIPCAVLAVEDVLCFDDSRLSLLYSRLRDVGSHSLVIASLNGVLCAKTMGDVTPYEAVRTAVSLLSARGSVLPMGHIEATVNGSLIKFDHTRTGLAFYPEIKYIS